jgi:hypothetical protein
VSAWKRVLVGEGGFGAGVGTLLLIGAGAVMTFLGTQDLREAVATTPRRLKCAEFLATPQVARWVVLEGCRLDLNAATTRRWKGWWSRADAGSPARHLELFIPLSSVGEAQPERPAVVLATTNANLLTLVHQLERLPVEQVDAFIDARAAELEAALAPQELRGYVQPMASSGSRTALAEMMAEGAVVLEEGQEPRRGNALCSLGFGLALMLFAFWPMARRFQLERDQPSWAPPPGGEGP